MSKAKKKKYTYDFPMPSVTVDLIIVSKTTPRTVLLIRRKEEPFANAWALPGGFINMDESLEEAARRELLEETGVAAKKLKQLHTFGEPGRDPRGRVISVAYVAEVNPERVKPVAADDAADVGWFSLARPPGLAFDHGEVLACARRWLRGRGT